MNDIDHFEITLKRGQAYAKRGPVPEQTAVANEPEVDLMEPVKTLTRAEFDRTLEVPTLYRFT